jgi:predicted ABC-type ATPase
MPECHIIAGPNGAGKTTFAREFLPNYVDCLNFINPDLIAAGLSPFDASLAMSKAGRLVIGEIRDRATRGESFGFETTLSGRLYARTIDMLRARGYRVCLYYLWVPSPELALMRIHNRVEAGGHDVPEMDVRRRYVRSLSNLFRLYRKRLDAVYFFDNARRKPQLIFLEEAGLVSVYNRWGFVRITNEVK